MTDHDGIQDLVRVDDDRRIGDRQRTIGLLGGMSWESTAVYYRIANELVRERLGGLHSARVILASVDFAEIEELQIAGQWDQAGQLLAGVARDLASAGAGLLLLCTNTMHKVAGEIEAAVRVPLLHIVDVTADAIVRAELNTVGLLGTAFTMEQPFYRDRLAAHGLRVLVPPSAARTEVHRIIYEELCLGVVTDESRETYREIIAELASGGAQSVIVGCTEIALLVAEQDGEVPLFDTTRLHVEAAVEWALADVTQCPR